MFSAIRILDGIASVRDEGDWANCYQRLVDEFSLAAGISPSLIVIVGPFTGYEEHELSYMPYFPSHAGYLCWDKGEKAILLRSSSILTKVRKGRRGPFPLGDDPYLFKTLEKHLPADCDTRNLSVCGEVIFRDNKPVAFALTHEQNMPFFETEGWEVTNRAIGISAQIRTGLYDEKNRFYDALSRIALDLQKTFAEEEIGSVDVMQRVLDSTLFYLNAEKCALFLVDSTEESLVLERAAGAVDFQRIRNVATYPIKDYDPSKPSTGVTPWVLHRGKPFNARSFQELRGNSEGHWKGNWDGPMYSGTESAAAKFQCVYMVPLMVGEKGIGVLKYENRLCRCDSTSITPYFDEADERMIDVIGALVTNLIVSQRIERNRYDAALPQISNVLVSSFGQDNFYEDLLDKCRSILEAEICSLFLVQSDKSLALKAIVGVSDDEKKQLDGLKYPNYESAKGLTPWILLRRKSFNVRSYPDLKGRSEDHHVGQWDKIVYHNQPEKEFKSLYSIPLIIGDEPIGVFKIENKTVQPFYFTESDERLFDLIGRLIAIGVKYDQAQYLGGLMRAAELGFLASGIAHEFNNYLQTFRSVIANIRKYGASNKKISAKVDTLTKEVDKADETIANFRQIRDQRQEARDSDLNELILQVLDIAQKRFEDSGIQLTYENEEQLQISLNASDVRTVLINLLNNAFDAVMQTQDKRTVIVRVHRSNDEGMFCLSVRDTGPGISRADQPHIFAPFFTTKGPRGMGIGLYWVQRVVNNLGGSITVESGVGRGSTFSVELPLSGIKVSG